MQEQFCMFSDLEKLEEERNYKVVKSNRLIQKARFSLSLQQQKFILYAISLIQPTDERGKTYMIDIPHLCRVCGINYSTGNFKQIYKNIEAVKKAPFWFKPTGNKARELIDWITEVSVIEDSEEQDLNITVPRVVSFKFDRRLEDYLFELSRNFTEYEINNILPMKSAYSIRMYELLRSYANVGSVVIKIEELAELLQVDADYTFKEFNRRVIQKAISEINRFTDLLIVDEQLRTGHKVTAINFTIKTKSSMERQISALKGDSVLNKANKADNDNFIKMLGGNPDE